MKHTFTLAILWIFMLAVVPKAFSQDPNFYIFLCFGQSNMEGQGPIETQDQTVNSRFQVMQAVACTGQPQGAWRTATPPIARCNTKLGPSDYFGREMIANLPANVKVGIVHVSIAGSKIEIFDKANYQSYLNGLSANDQYIKNIANEYGGNPYARLVALAKTAQQSGVIKGILLHQGESNTGDNAWPTKVKGVYTNLLTDLGLSASNVPLLAGQVVDAAQGGLCASMNNIINTLPNTIPTSYVISSSGCTDQSDNLHFTSAGYRILGARYAQKMLTLITTATGTSPVVTLTAPTATSFTAPASITITATATDADGTISNVKFYNGTNLLSTVTTSPYTYTWTSVAAGTYSITAVATDNSGATTTSAAKSVTVTATGTGGTATTTSCGETGNGAYYTGVYRNMFKELLNKTDAEVNAKVEAAFQQLFYGTTNQKVYYEVGSDMAYIQDVANNDVRTEGMSYGMMICVQLNKQAEFNKIWKWAKTKMQRSDGFFNWQLNTDGTIKGSGPASDGEAYFITALLFAENRWGNGTGINNYGAEAQDILKRVMSQGGNSNLFNANSKLITFVPSGDSYTYTDPSYNLPGFWELWKRWSTTNTTFWAQTPDAARKLLRDASNPTSGLYADYSNFDGTPKTTSFNSDSHRFMYDAWRTIMNLGMDYHWFQSDAQQPIVAERYLTFFKNQGSGYKNHYDWNGTNAGGDHSTGLVACNAVASLAVANTTLTTPFVQEFWNVGIPNGTYRYYDGMLYMLAMLNCSGNFKIWKPACPNTCATPAPTVSAATVTYDVNAIATQLTATGTSLKWYTVSTGGTALAAAPTPGTTTTGTTVYYVGQTLNGCEGTRTAVTIKVVNNYKIYKVAAPVTVDGTVDAVWNNASVLPAAAAKLLSGTVTNSADLSGNFKALWDDTYLYVLADVSDELKVNESTNVYDDDGVEVYVDINNDKATTYGANDVQYTFGWNDGTTVGFLPTGRSVTGITYSAVARTGGYIVEARIPWTTLQGTPAIGQIVGLDFMINDDDDNTTRDGKLSWNAATDDAWQNPSLFGNAILQGLLACTTPAAPTVTATVTYCQGATATQLTATGTGLKWYADNTTTTALAAAPTPSTTTAGTTSYFVSQTTSGCESARAQITVTVNALPTATITAGGATTFCTGGSVTLTSSAGTSYIWKEGTTQVGTAATYAATAAGSYTVEVTNAANCKATSAATVVTVNTPPAAPTVTATVAYCLNATATQLTATGTALKWYADNTTTTALAAAPTPSTTTAGTTSYFVSQTTSGCESARAQITVTVNALPTATITAGGATTFCTGGSVTLTSSAGTSYIWKEGTTQVGTAATYAATAAGSYTVEVRNVNNCKETSSATVVTINTAGAAPTVTATVAYCQGATATQLAATGTGLKWYADNTTTTALASAPIPSTASAGTTSYFVSQTTSGCESARAQITVTVNALPTATITAGGATTFCTGGSVILTSSAGSSYIWKNGGTQVGTGATYSATTSGSYTVEVFSATNCKATSAATVVTINTPPAAPTVTATVAYCQGVVAALLNATGTGLKWYADNTTATPIGSTPTPITTAVGTSNYFVSQSTNGCESTRAQIVVTINALPTAVITPASTTAIPVGGSVILNANTGSGLQYKWFKGSAQVGTGASYTANAVGSYVVEVTNASGCKATSLAVDVTNAANQPSQISITSPTTNTTIPGTVTITATVSDPDGTITLVEYLDGNTVIGTSTTHPYSFDWTNPGEGTHVITVRVTDSNGGITTSAPVTITSSSTSTGVNSSASISATVYPNPSNGDVYVETNMDLSNAHFRVINVLGEEAVLYASINSSGARLDVSTLTEGAYILIITEGTSVIRKKITVIR